MRDPGDAIGSAARQAGDRRGLVVDPRRGVRLATSSKRGRAGGVLASDDLRARWRAARSGIDDPVKRGCHVSLRSHGAGSRPRSASRGCRWAGKAWAGR